MTMIQPTIGRVVWYRPPQDAPLYDRSQPWAAIVTYVHSDRMVNLVVFDQNGMGKSKTSVTLVQNGDAPPTGGGSYAEWMPYQKGQAAKTEAAEMALHQS